MEVVEWNGGKFPSAKKFVTWYMVVFTAHYIHFKKYVTFLFLSQRLQYVRNVILYNSLNLKK